VEYATREQAQQAVTTLSNQNLMGRLVYVREVRVCASPRSSTNRARTPAPPLTHPRAIGSRGRAAFHRTILPRRIRWSSSWRIRWRLRPGRRRRRWWWWWWWWWWWPSNLRLQRLFPSKRSPTLLHSILTLDILASLQRWLAGPEGLVSPSR
jgi:hypothetical protein